MSRLQRLQFRQSELRSKIAGILDSEERSEEEQSNLDRYTTEIRQVESDIRAAMVLGEDEDVPIEDGQPAEQRALLADFSIARVLRHKILGTPVDGREAEWAASEDLPAGAVPTNWGTRTVDESETEQRAHTPGVQGGINQRPIVPALFDRSVAPFLGVSMVAQGVGDASFPVLSTSLTADVKARGAAAPETAGAFTVTTKESRRLTGSFRIRYEDLARLIGMEAALRSNLNMVMSDELDKHTIDGDSSAGDGKVQGLLPQLTSAAAPATGLEDWGRFNTALTGHIDCLHATTEAGVRALVGPHTYRLMARVFRATESNESFSAYWNRVGGGVRGTRRIADPSSHIQQAIVVRNNPANDAAAVMAHWSSFDLQVRDIYTSANKGEVVVTAMALVSDVVILRGGVYVQDSFRVTS